MGDPRHLAVVGLSVRARHRGRAGERAGLLASSNALRLKPEGLHVKAPIDVCHWFLNGNDDVRSSNALEDAATEFAVQGLELDWTGVAWDLNLRRSADGWQAREFRGTKWNAIRSDGEGFSRADYVKNAYRVLLTRARQGMVIHVPRGDPADITRPPAEYDAIADWLADRSNVDKVAAGVCSLIPAALNTLGDQDFRRFVDRAEHDARSK